MKRRNLMVGAVSTGLAGSFGLARPAIGQGATRTLKFVPQANLANPDPVWTTTIVAANHAYMIWDQLWTFDESLVPQPQMLAGVVVSGDKLTWRLTLRDGLLFHDGERVRSVDCIASLLRWMKRDGMGQRIAAQLDEMKVVDDRTFEIVLKKAFPLLPMAFANNCHIMPERMARTDAFQQIAEYVGSGPFKFVRDEWVSGSRAVYVRNDKYVPRSEAPNNMSGGKVVHLDRVEWHITGDPSTAAAAVQTGEIDWLEQPLADLLPVLRRAPGVTVESTDLFGNAGLIRFNHLHPPFSNQKLRQAVLAMVDQKDFLAAIMGADSPLTQSGVGVFTPGTPLASDAAMEKLTGKRDLVAARKLVAESGYRGEKAWFGWPTSPRMEALRDAWFDAPDLATQQKH